MNLVVDSLVRLDLEQRPAVAPAAAVDAGAAAAAAGAADAAGAAGAAAAAVLVQLAFS